MFKIKKIRITNVQEFEDAKKALKEAKGAAEIRITTEMGDLVISKKELKKIAENYESDKKEE